MTQVEAQAERDAIDAKAQRFFLRATVSNAVELIEPEEVITELLSFSDFLLYIDTVSEHDTIETSATPDQLRAIVAQYVVRDSTATRQRSTTAEARAALTRAKVSLIDARDAMQTLSRLTQSKGASIAHAGISDILKELRQWQD